MDNAKPIESRIEPSSQLLAAILALSIGAVIVVSAALVYYLTGDHFSARTAFWLRAKDFALTAGEGGRKPGQLEIRQVSAQGVALLSSPPLDIAADRYSELRWRIDGLQPQTDARFVWTTRNAPSVLQEAPLDFSGKSTGRLSLASLPNWRGSINGVGLIVRGVLDRPIVLRRLGLVRPTSSANALLQQLWLESSALETWSQRSINFIAGGSPQALLPAVPAVAAWVALSACLFAAWRLIRRRPWTMAPFGVFLLVGWLLLDTRWQWHLWRQAEQTREQYAGKTWEQKRLAAADGRLFQFMEAIRAKMPSEPVRVILLSADPMDKTRYIRSRAHYHLLPHNVNSSLSRLPARTRKGDYILLLGPVPGIHYDPHAHLLSMTQGEPHPASVELLYNSSAGALFRVQGAGNDS